MNFLLASLIGTLCSLYSHIAYTDTTEHKIIKLADMMTVNEQINLKNVSDFYNFNLALSSRVKLQKITLHLELIHSAVLVKER
jgi:hypothetical protein